MPRLRKVGKVWWSDLYIAGKRVRGPLSTDKTIALERLAALARDGQAARYGHPNRTTKWETFKNKFLAASSKGAATQKRDRAAISTLEQFQTLNTLSDITPELLERWKSHRMGQGKGAATINRDLQSIKAMMAVAGSWGYLTKWDGKSVKKLRQAKGRLLFYTVEECNRLLGICRSRMSGFYNWETLCLLGLRAGLRRAEIYWLSWRDVDLERGIISVIPKGGWIPKTGEQRHLPIPDDLKRHLRGLERKTEWVLGDRPSLAVMSAFFQKISRKAKLTGNIHTLRHTYASHLVQAGVPLYTVAKLMGHSSIRTTEIYAHLAPATLESAVAMLPRLK